MRTEYQITVGRYTAEYTVSEARARKRYEKLLSYPDEYGSTIRLFLNGKLIKEARRRIKDER